MTRVVFFFLLLSVCSQAYAQKIDSTGRRIDSTTQVHLQATSKGHIMWHDFKESVYDGGQYIERPLHWNLREWLIIGTVGGVTALFTGVDDNIARGFFQRNQSSVGDAIATVGNFYGSGIPTIITGLGLYGIGLETDNSKVRVMGRHVIQSFAYAGLTTTAIKILIGRERPFNGSGPDVFHGFSLKNAWNSLPSGHATVACALSSTLAAEIDNPYVTAGLYALVGTTVFGRLYTDNHWLSDTFLGGVIGSVAGYWVAAEVEHYDTNQNSKETGFVIEPGIGNITFAYRW